ncbi:MAG: hypothetical protein HQ567_19770 [Candidatus Nealsonbacteria bacterium]|nr:hypothetical protein [Candidatus Nealsonbacteria bacterium]
MTTLTRTCFALLAGLSVIDMAAAQDAIEKPFAQYADAPARYLKRIHGDGVGALAFRPDYPGGFAAWQRDARNKLVDLLGLTRIRRDAGDHRPVVHLGKPVQEDGYHRRRGDIETEPGVTIPFWLLTPDDETTATRPLAICAHGHDSDGWNTYAGVYRDDDHRKTTLAKDGDPDIMWPFIESALAK